MRFLYRIPLAALLVASALFLVSAFVFPISETSYAGNYHLRHLSAAARREMRSQISPLSKTDYKEETGLENTSLQFALRPGTIVSVYLPHAGFLWSDFNAWDEEQAIFYPLDMSSSSLEAAARRVVFKDPIGRMS
jgi:hypothetical protein